MLNLQQIDVPNRCSRFAERCPTRITPGAYTLPFVAAAAVLAAARSLPADRRRAVRGHVQELRRRHLGDAPVELVEVLRVLTAAIQYTELRSEDEREREEARRRRSDRIAAELLHRKALAKERERKRQLEELLMTELDDDVLAGGVPGLERVELTAAEWGRLV